MEALEERNFKGHINRVLKYIFCYEIIKYAVQAPMETGSFSIQSTLITQLNREYVIVWNRAQLTLKTVLVTTLLSKQRIAYAM